MRTRHRNSRLKAGGVTACTDTADGTETAALEQEIKNLVSRLYMDGYESLIVTLQRHSHTVNCYGSDIGKGFLNEKTNIILDFSKFYAGVKDQTAVLVKIDPIGQPTTNGIGDDSMNTTDLTKSSSTCDIEGAHQSSSGLEQYTGENRETNEDMCRSAVSLPMEHTELAMSQIQDSTISNKRKTVKSVRFANSKKRSVTKQLCVADLLRMEPTVSNGSHFEEPEMYDFQDNRSDRASDQQQDKLDQQLSSMPVGCGLQEVVIHPDILNKGHDVTIALENLDSSELIPNSVGTFDCPFCHLKLHHKNQMGDHVSLHRRIFSSPVDKCDICGILLPTKVYMYCHKLSHRASQPIPDNVVTVARDLRDDIAYMESVYYTTRNKKSKDPCTCKYCGEVKSGIYCLKAHFISQHTKKYICQLCGSVMLGNLQMLKHIDEHKFGKQSSSDMAKSVGDKLACSLCDFTTTTKRLLREHHKRKHMSEEFKKFPCPDCEMKFNTKLLLQTHAKVHGDRYPCQYEGCTEKCCTYNQLESHLKSHRPSQPHLCNECGSTFKRKYALRKHQETYHNDGKPIQCTKCDRMLPGIVSWKAHQRLHQNKTYVCELCGASFNSGAKIWRHRRHSHSQRDIHRCEDCGKEYLQEAGLHQHMLVSGHFKPGQTANDLKHHECPVTDCSKLFVKKDKLDRHMRCHSGETPYSCCFCGKEFKESTNLQQHKRIHTSVRPTCDVCQAVFRSNKQLHVHKSSIHSITCDAVKRQHPTCHICSESFYTIKSLNEHVKLAHDQGSNNSANSVVCPQENHGVSVHDERSQKAPDTLPNDYSILMESKVDSPMSAMENNSQNFEVKEEQPTTVRQMQTGFTNIEVNDRQSTILTRVQTQLHVPSTSVLSGDMVNTTKPDPVTAYNSGMVGPLVHPARYNTHLHVYPVPFHGETGLQTEGPKQVSWDAV